MHDNIAERIFICGFMGAGKSTIGQGLAQRLQLAFWDLDTIIEEQAGQTIPNIFETKGEKYFRKTEQEVINRVSSKRRGVIALGGGSLQNQSIVNEIKSNGLLVFIEASMEAILQRVTENTDRPMLWDSDGQMKSKQKLRETMQPLYRQRLPLYQQADITVKSDNTMTVKGIVNQFIKIINEDARTY